MTKGTEMSKGKAFSCHTERRKTQRLEMESANIVLTADGGMGGGGPIPTTAKKAWPSLLALISVLG